MSAAQRTKRKTAARINLDDEDILPAKKRSKVDAEPTGTNGATNGRPSRRKKQVYEEEVDGFAFRRKNTKRSQAEEPVTVAPEPAVASIPEPRRKKSPVAAKVVVPTRETRRRSARLSSENEVQLEAASKPQPKPRKSRKVDPPKSPPIPEVECRTKQVAGSEQKLEVNKARSKGTTIALPFADTPVIKRNKEMRAAHGGRNSSQNRRSSSGLRGRRASSLIDSGTSNGMRDMPPLHELASAAFFMARNFQTLTANMPEFNDMAQATEQLEDPFDSKHVKEQNLHANLLDSTALPHSEVEISDFFKLIEQSLPEQKRMRHLLMWSSERAVLSKPRPADGQSTNETIAVESARQIQEELVKDYTAKEALADWWSREDSAGPSLPKKINPRNVRNKDKVQELEEEIKRLEAEENSWKTLLSPSNLQTIAGASSTESTAPINSSVLPASQQSLLSYLQSSTMSPESLSTTLTSLATSLEPTIDACADGIHRLTTYMNTSKTLADKIKHIWAERLENRDEEAKRAAGSDTVAGRDVLRALAGRLNDG